VNHKHNWHGYPFIAHTLAEVRGNGWGIGPRDERGVRAATMQDGNPNGYYVISFRSTDFTPRFVPASGNPAEGMRIVLDPLLEGSVDELGNVITLNRGTLAPGTKVVVNLFDGGERDSVQISLDDAPYVEMTNVLRNDPFMDRQFAQYEGTPDEFESPEPSSHIWEHALPDNLAPGLHTVRVIALDEFDQFAEAALTFELE
jgi:C terminal of Calcineurin-like phosphoesterase